MPYITPPAINTKIGSKTNIKRYTKPFIPRVKTVTIEAVVEEERIALDNKFRASFLNSLYGTKQPNYSKQEVINVLERER